MKREKTSMTKATYTKPCPILRNARAQSVMIDELVAFSEMVAGRLTIQAEVVNLSEIVGEMVESIQTAVEVKQLRLNVNLADQAWVSGDAQRLRQISSSSSRTR